MGLCSITSLHNASAVLIVMLWNWMVTLSRYLKHYLMWISEFGGKDC